MNLYLHRFSTRSDFKNYDKQLTLRIVLRVNIELLDIFQRDADGETTER